MPGSLIVLPIDDPACLVFNTHATSTITFSVVEPRTGTPTVGIGLVLKCLSPTTHTFLGRIDTSGGASTFLFSQQSRFMLFFLLMCTDSARTFK